MDVLTVLPPAVIAPSGPCGRKFLGKGICRFDEAALWLKGLPYGRPLSGDMMEAVFEEG